MAESEYYTKVLSQKPLGWTFRDPGEVSSFRFEEIDLFWWRDLAQNNWKWAFYAGTVYILTIFGLQRYMKNRPAMDLRMPLFYWNFTLGVFSIVGFARTAPGLVETLNNGGGFYGSICAKQGLDIPTAFWVLCFILSKFLELGDTVFIVLRKRPLIFLQWYHHVITMTVVWLLAPLVEPIARWYAILNYGVHSLMYPYFAARAIGIKVPLKVANLITTLQFAQMVIGLGINVLSMYLQQTGYPCIRYPVSIKLFCLVYGSFFILFGNLFYNSVIKKGNEKRLAKKID